jgi:hypothetical protein
MTIDVKATGPLFSAKALKAAENAIITEVLDETDKRMQRSANARRSKGRKLVTNPLNTITTKRHGLTAEYQTTLRGRRTTGVAWRRKNLSYLVPLVKNKTRKVLRRMVEEVG